MLCNKCGKEIKIGSRFCNHCGASQEEEQNKNSNLSIFLIVGSIFIIGILGSFILNKTKNSNNTSKIDLKLLDSSFCQIKYGNRGICGSIINNSNTTYKYVSVKINLYDDNNTFIGSTSANKNHLEPNNKWIFEAPISENNIKNYKIEDISGF